MQHKLDEILRKLAALEHKFDAAQSKPYGVSEAAEYLGVSKAYLYKLIGQAELPFSKPGGKLVYFKKSDLDAWVFSRRSKSKEELRAIA
jgi:prophage regulatory protein